MFAPPTFNLPCSIWRASSTDYAHPDGSATVNLAWSKRVDAIGDGTESLMHLLLPAHTDIRGAWNGQPADVVEVPRGTHRFYQVGYVDDIGKGFANEHRCAVLIQNVFGLFGFNFPVPLP